MGLKIYGFFIVAGLLFSVGYGAYWYYNDTQARIQILTENNANLETAVKTNEAAVKSMKADVRTAQAENVRINNQFEAGRARTRELESRLGKHDIGVLGEAKPGLVGNIVNKGTRDTQRCFEILSGSPLTKEELDATTKDKINTSCPNIANPNYVITD
jgi:hypothetical protein